MAQSTDDELMADFIALEPESSTNKTVFQASREGPQPSRVSAKSHFHEIHPEVEVYAHKCVCGRYFKAIKDMRTHQKATGHGACVCGENFTTYAELHRHRYEAVHLVRCTCDKIFGSTQHLLSHQRLEDHHGYRDKKLGPLKKSAVESDTLHQVLCPCGDQIKDDGSGEPLQCSCGRVFQDAYGPARDAYDAGTTAFSCCCCGSVYDTWDEMWHHQLFIHHPCIACHKIFVSEARLMQHQRSTNHCHCRDCDEHFMTPDRLRQHLIEVHHASRAEVFQDAADDERPLDDASGDGSGGGGLGRSWGQTIFKGGFKSGKNFLHVNLRCRVCGQEFTSPKTLHDHRTRGWHDPFTSSRCPLPGCADGEEREYASVSGLLHHLESAQCGSGITLPDFNRAMRGAELERFVAPEFRARPTPEDPCARLAERDIVALCEQQAALAAGSGSSSSSGGGGSSQGAGAAGANAKLKCPFCASSWKTYPTRAQLKAHLSMYNHTPRYLTYPDFVVLPPTKSKRKANFGSWSGLAHSLETLLCAGDIEGVQRALDTIEDRIGTLGLEEADMMVD